MTTMEEEYVNRVLIYLKQELPVYQDQLSVKNNKLVITVPADQVFQPFYEKTLESVSAAITRIRKRKAAIEFTVRSSAQERDFSINPDLL